MIAPAESPCTRVVIKTDNIDRPSRVPQNRFQVLQPPPVVHRYVYRNSGTVVLRTNDGGRFREGFSGFRQWKEAVGRVVGLVHELVYLSANVEVLRHDIDKSHPGFYSNRGHLLQNGGWRTGQDGYDP